MTTRDELANALARRYAVAGKAEKSLILDEFEAITGMFACAAETCLARAKGSFA